MRPHKAFLTMMVAVLLANATSAWSAAIGDTARPITIEQWIKGDPVVVDGSPSPNLYVVEFWATWCGPCRTSIPHLTKLQEKYQDDVVFIGVSDEPPETVQPFVEEMGEKMNYRVAVDTSRNTHRAYMGAYGQNGIPTAFIVDLEGRVAWLGHPMGDLDDVLAQMLDGTYDSEATITGFRLERDSRHYFELVRAGKDDDARQLGQAIVREGSRNARLLNEFAWNILVEARTPSRDLELGMMAAKAAYDACAGKDPNVVDTYARAFYETGDLVNAIAYQEMALSLAQDERLRAMLQVTLDEYRNQD